MLHATVSQASGNDCLKKTRQEPLRMVRPTASGGGARDALCHPCRTRHGPRHPSTFDGAHENLRVFWKQHRLRNSRSGRQSIDTATVAGDWCEGRLQAKKPLIPPPANNAVLTERGRFRAGQTEENSAPKTGMCKAKIRPPPRHPPHHDASGPLPPATHTSDGERGKLRPAAVRCSVVAGGGNGPPFMFTAAREKTQQYPHTVTLCRVYSAVDSTQSVRCGTVSRGRKGELEPLGNLTVIWVSCPLVGSVSGRPDQGQARVGPDAAASHEHDKTPRSRLKKSNLNKLKIPNNEALATQSSQSSRSLQG